VPERYDQYEGDEGQERLRAALGLQDLLAGEATAIEAVARFATLWTYESGETIIDQKGGGDDLFFILQGSARICANKREIRIRKARCHVGEIALIDPEGGRSADVIALERCVVARLEGRDFRTLADSPGNHLWRTMARILSDRLREHTERVRTPNIRPQIFLGSTSEARPVMRALKEALDDGIWAHFRPWDGDIFQASSTTIEDLEQLFRQVDFAVLLATDEDWARSRGHTKASPRDNIILEIGLGMGSIGRGRTYVVTPRRPPGEVKWPTDLLGVNFEHFDDNPRSGRLRRLLGPQPAYSKLTQASLDEMVSDVADRLRRRMEKEGPI
jgi:CRP/FNR family cyclic AMP-dependent transcriptional regulator